MADLPSILGGMAQGFVDFGKGVVDMFGTGGAAIGDLIEGARTGKVTTKNQDDFRKWLYQTDSTKDAAAKGLGTALNGVQTVLDYIPGVNVLTRNPLGNAAQGALGGLADEFKTYGEDYDLGRAGQRAAVSGAAAAASGSLADALKGSSNALLSSNTLQGLARGATGGAITGGGYAAIDGGDVLEAAKQGAGMGALIGGATGAFQDFKPAKTYDMALTDSEKQARAANIDDQLSRLDTSTPEGSARYNELMNARANYADNRQAQFDLLQKTNPMMDDYHTGIRSPEDIYTLKSIVDSYNADNNFTYPDFTLADAQKALASGNIDVYSSKPIEAGAFISPSKMMATDYAGGGEVYTKNIPLRDFAFIESGDEGNYLPTARALETTLSDADMAVNNPRYLTDENGNPRTFYHGSPNKNITEFDINQAGKNTSSGEHALYFTDSPEVADEFSYERLPSDSMFVDNRGAKGRVYPVNLEMNNPLDLDNLTDAQIRELWQYASPLGQLDGQEKFIKNLTEFRDAAHNGQLTKTLLDLDKLKNSPYDGFTARMYPNQDNQAREYAVFDNSKVKMLEDVLANDDMAVNNPKLTPEQEAYFKDSVIRDENGNLMPLYHGSNSKFTVFDSSKGGQSNKTAKVGHWFTPNEEGARSFANSVWYGDESEPTVYSTYLNVKNPKIYEAVDNSAQIKALNNEMDVLQRQLDGMRRGSDEFNATYKKYNDLAKQIDNLSYGDPYEQFRSDIYAMEGKTPYQANVGGLGMMMDDEDAATQKYVQSLRDQGYDGIIIRGTNYDNGTLGGVNDQYVAFDSNQIKDINNLKPTDAPSIMESRITPEELDLARTLANQDMAVNGVQASKIAPGQLGLFDDMPTQTPKTGTRQTSLFDQPDNPYLDYYGADIDATPLAPETPVNPYAPVNGEVTQAMRDRAADILGNWKKNGVPENELYNAINPDTLPLGYKEAIDVLDNIDAKKYLKDNLGVTDIKKAKFDKVLDYLFGDNEDAKRTYSELRDQQIQSAKEKAKLLGLPEPSKSFVPSVEGKLREEVSYKMAKDIRKSLRDIPVDAETGEVMPLTQANLNRLDPKVHSFRTGYTAAADEAFSERLGIAPGNTPKYNGRIDVRGAYGRYSHPMYGVGGDVAIFERKIDNPEDAISSVAHERLHSFQNEATNSANNAGRYSKEVENAFKDLRKDLEQHYKSWDETAKRYGGGRGNTYWNSQKEQEARMLETYLQNKGYTDAPGMKNKYRAGEWGNEINPAFDKFFDKLRDLSKRGVALPALAALFGGGAYMASQENDKEKEVK